MGRSTRERRASRRIVSILATLGLVGGLLALSTAGATAARNTCRAKNVTQGTTTSSNLQAAIDGAHHGDTIRVRGVCAGRSPNFGGSQKEDSGFVIETDITIVGFPARPLPVLRLIGKGRVLFVAARVTLANLRITGGSGMQFGGGIFNRGDSLTLKGSVVSGNAAGFGGGISNFKGSALTLKDSDVRRNKGGGGGGGIYNTGTLILNGSSSVIGNTGGYGGGIANDGNLTLNDTSSVRGNSGRNHGGGIANDGNLTLNDTSSVRGNTDKSVGGGIYNYGHLTLNDSSLVRANTAKLRGGGIFNDVSGAVILKDSALVRGNTATLGGGIVNDSKLRSCDNTGVDEWTGAISPNVPDDPPVVTPITC